MSGYAEMLRKVQNMFCPRCYHTPLVLTFHLDDEQGRSYYLVTCQDCGFVFEVNHDTPTPEDIERRVRELVQRQGCPRCGKSQFEFDFRCLVETRQCFHVATCRGCGASFVVEEWFDRPLPAILDL